MKDTTLSFIIQIDLSDHKIKRSLKVTFLEHLTQITVSTIHELAAISGKAF